MSGIMNMFVAAKTTVAETFDAFFNRVTLLLNTSSTTGAQNNTFLDSSTNNFTITRNGNTTQGTFTPFSQTGWSNYFNGSSSYLSAPNNAAYDVGSGTFCIEMFVNVSTLATMQGLFSWSVSLTGIELAVNTNGQVGITLGTGSAWVVDNVNAGAVTTNTWNHIAWVRSSGTMSVFINGTRTYTVANSTTVGNPSTIAALASNRGTSTWLTGYISNFRFIKGSTPYDPTSSTITVPTTPLTAITNTSLLTCQDNRFKDNSSNAFAISTGGTPSVQAFSPFLPTAAYDAAVVGGSSYQDASGDYLSCATNTSAFQLGASDWCIEGWVYSISSSTSYLICGQTDQATIGGSSFFIGYNGESCSAFSGGGRIDFTIGQLDKYAWTHLAFCRSGSTVSCFKNGTRVGTGTFSGTINNGSTTYPPKIGAGGNSTGTEQYISNVRIVKGSSPYNAASTTIAVPTAPLTAITNTAILCNFTNAGIYDSAAKNVLETVGNAQVSTTQAKWGTTSMAFDGTGDYLVLNPATTDLYSFGSGDWTIEFWVYLNSVSGLQNIYDGRPASTATTQPLIYMNAAVITYYTGGSDRITGSTLSTGQWYHIAVARSGTSTKMFVNGTQSGSTYTDSSVYTNTSQRPIIGASGFTLSTNVLNGYIDDLRITKGYARYTANFTAPTAAFFLL